MKKLPETIGPLEYHRAGLRLVPLDGKRPLVKNWPELHLGEDAIRAWERKGVNWGAITGDPLIVIDIDTDAAAEKIRAMSITSSVVVQSGGGGDHLWFLKPENVTIVPCKTNLHGIPGLDVKGHHGCIVLPGSIHPETGQRYEFAPGKEFTSLADLPPFDPKWVLEIREEPGRKPHANEMTPRRSLMNQAVHQEVRDVMAYVMSIPSVEGQGGSNACYRVACILYDAGKSFEEILAAMEEWNEVAAFPRWSRQELIHKISSVFKRKAK
jgi:hypothetical protein